MMFPSTQQAVPAGQPSDFILSAFASRPGSALKLPRASSLAFADSARHPPGITPATGRSASLLLHPSWAHAPVPGAGLWSDPWDDIVAAALESEGGGDNPQVSLQGAWVTGGHRL